MPLLGKFRRLINNATQPDDVIAQAIDILRSRMKAEGIKLSSPNQVKAYLICQFGTSDREIFSVLWMDVRNRLIDHEILFYGTLTHCSVYPREVVKAGLRLNAASCILVHNHPSGAPDPSEADQLLTRTLIQTLALVDVRVLDHIIVAGTRTCSFAENGLI